MVKISVICLIWMCVYVCDACLCVPIPFKGNSIFGFLCILCAP